MPVRIQVSQRELQAAKPALLVCTEAGQMGPMASAVDLVCECGKVTARLVQDKGRAHLLADSADRVNITSRDTPWVK